MDNTTSCEAERASAGTWFEVTAEALSKSYSLIELTQFPRIRTFHGQNSKPQSGEDELRIALPQLDRGLK